MAIIKTMKGAKSNFQIKAMNMKPNCNVQRLEEGEVLEISSIWAFVINITSFTITYHYTNGN